MEGSGEGLGRPGSDCGDSRVPQADRDESRGAGVEAPGQGRLLSPGLKHRSERTLC